LDSARLRVHPNNQQPAVDGRKGDAMLFRTNQRCAVLLAVVALLAGCASSPPEPKFTHVMVVDSRIRAADSAEVNITAPDTIKIQPSERQRVAEKIKAQIDVRKAKNSEFGDPRTYLVVLNVTRYDKGNAFARAMLAGVGQIHLDGTISLFQMPERTLVEEFDMQKTFAWGGIYGAATSMETIEDTFCDSVAATVTGQQQPAAAATTKTAAAPPKN
jgi:hypothetical protein